MSTYVESRRLLLWVCSAIILCLFRNLFVCMVYIFVCGTCAWKCKCACTCLCVSSDMCTHLEANCQLHMSSSTVFYLIFEKASFDELTRLASETQSPPVSGSQLCNYRHVPLHLAFYMCAGDQTQALMFSEQAFLLTSHCWALISFCFLRDLAVKSSLTLNL